MPLTHETVKTTYKVGGDRTVKHQRYFNYTLANASKDLLREAARYEGMANYSTQNADGLRAYLAGLNPPVSELRFQIVKL
jgi:hypothetical protein